MLLFSTSDAQTLVHYFVMSHFDYGNSLFIGLPTKSLQRLQYIKNTAARLLTRTKPSAHNTLVLSQLHWLPVLSWIQIQTSSSHLQSPPWPCSLPLWPSDPWAPKPWNSLHQSLRECAPFPLFKANLRSFRLFYHHCIDHSVYIIYWLFCMS